LSVFSFFDQHCQLIRLHESSPIQYIVLSRDQIPRVSETFFSLIAAAPLTPETVTEAVEEVKWETLCSCLFVPNSKRDEIESQYPPNDRLRVLVDWWISTDPAPSWRRLIQQLDMWCVTVTADRVRCNAEPIQGMYLH